MAPPLIGHPILGPPPGLYNPQTTAQQEQGDSPCSKIALQILNSLGAQQQPNPQANSLASSNPQIQLMLKALQLVTDAQKASAVLPLATNHRTPHTPHLEIHSLLAQYQQTLESTPSIAPSPPPQMAPAPFSFAPFKHLSEIPQKPSGQTFFRQN